MLRGDVIRLMCTLLASILGEEKFKAASIEFKEAAVEGAVFLDKMEEQAKQVSFDGVVAEVSNVWTPSDCQALFNLIAALQATQASECPIA